MSFPPQTEIQSGDCCVFKFLHRRVNGKHSMRFQIETSFKLLPRSGVTNKFFYAFLSLKNAPLYKAYNIRLIISELLSLYPPRKYMVMINLVTFGQLE